MINSWFLLSFVNAHFFSPSEPLTVRRRKSTINSWMPKEKLFFCQLSFRLNLNGWIAKHSLGNTQVYQRSMTIFFPTSTNNSIDAAVKSLTRPAGTCHGVSWCHVLCCPFAAFLFLLSEQAGFSFALPCSVLSSEVGEGHIISLIFFFLTSSLLLEAVSGWWYTKPWPIGCVSSPGCLFPPSPCSAHDFHLMPLATGSSCSLGASQSRILLVHPCSDHTCSAFCNC